MLDNKNIQKIFSLGDIRKKQLLGEVPERTRETYREYGYFNKGKYKGIEVDRPPIEYLQWLLNKSTIVLNKGEIKLITKLIENKKPH